MTARLILVYCRPRGDMVGQLRVPPRLVARLHRVEDGPKLDLFTVKRLRKNWSVRIFITLRTDGERRRNADKKRTKAIVDLLDTF